MKIFSWIGAAISKVFAVIGWLLSGFGLFKVFNKKNYKYDEVTVYKVHNAFFLWGIIITGFASSWIVNRYPSTAVFFGWVYIWVAMYTILAVLFDLGTLKLALTTVIVGFLWVSSAYLESVRGATLLSGVFGYIGGLKPALNTGMASVFSWLLLIPWVWSLFHAFSTGRVTISANGIEEWHLGIGSEITDRWGLKFRTRYDDLLEGVLGFGCGNLVAFNNDASGKPVKQYDNILMLFFWWKRLDELLHQRAAIVDNAPNESVDVAEQACKVVNPRGTAYASR
jgi:hypothetical protein